MIIAQQKSEKTLGVKVHQDLNLEKLHHRDLEKQPEQLI